jgi:hypothetical protein
MAITKVWEVNKCERELADGYVFKVIYRCKGLDGDTEKARATGSVKLPKPSSLIPYADLTASQVIGWVKAKLDADTAGTVASIEASLVSQINAINTPTTAEGNPWS